MKICVVGAGAIGGFMGARLAQQDHEVSLIARGPHLAAIKQNGLKLIQDGEEIIANNVVATDDINDLGVQDIVLMALKSHQIAAVMARDDPWRAYDSYRRSLAASTRLKSSRFSAQAAAA